MVELSSMAKSFRDSVVASLPLPTEWTSMSCATQFISFLLRCDVLANRSRNCSRRPTTRLVVQAVLFRAKLRETLLPQKYEVARKALRNSPICTDVLLNVIVLVELRANLGQGPLDLFLDADSNRSDTGQPLAILDEDVVVVRQDQKAVDEYDEVRKSCLKQLPGGNSVRYLFSQQLIGKVEHAHFQERGRNKILHVDRDFRSQYQELGVCTT
eukprot:m.139980 g.139980  ORF g.139980 m.139980 type:complete len:213 (-) comp10004_c2_seq3:88-726(-)